jgi:transcriptional regulator with XRE-family HTH domain
MVIQRNVVVAPSKGKGQPVDKHVGSRVRMRRLMLDMSQSTLGSALGLTFQQVQKYEKGSNRIGAGRLLHIASILQVPVEFFFEGAPGFFGGSHRNGTPATPDYVSEFLTTPYGLSLIKAFMQIRRPDLRRCIVRFVEEVARDAID